MDKKKIIQEMAYTLNTLLEQGGYCKAEAFCKGSNYDCKVCLATELYNAGYRKNDYLVRECEKLRDERNKYRRRARLFEGKLNEIRKETAREIIQEIAKYINAYKGEKEYKYMKPILLFLQTKYGVEVEQ